MAGFGITRPGDGVVEHPALWLELAEGEIEIGRVVLAANVLGQPNRRDRIEIGFRDIAIVAEPDLGTTGQALRLDSLLAPLGLMGRKGDADCVDSVVLDGVEHHAAPPAADIEEGHTRFEAELAADEIELRILCGLEGGVGGRKDRACVGHRRSEDPPVEAVRDVVMVLDGVGVTALGVPRTAELTLLGRRGRALERRGKE
ncbi:unannotated protein [freshwater metagenome]|uniref:Unannotated protein n=1 Tax=freshwater metagenome TaxID=449393 RepID=A0A6J7HT56_9ZZZZ